jgi:hypothetical protein
VLQGAECRFFKVKSFVRFARRERISDAALAAAVERADRGLVDADLGGGLIKQRVARPGQGRSGVFRTVIAYRAGERAVFLYGFAKNERDNIADHELEALRRIAALWLSADAASLARHIAEGSAEKVER